MAKLSTIHDPCDIIILDIILLCSVVQNNCQLNGIIISLTKFKCQQDDYYLHLGNIN